MTVAIFMYESMVPITGCRILIRNFIPGTLQGKKNILTNHEICLYLTISLSPNSPFKALQPLRTTWILPTQKDFSVFLLNAYILLKKKKLLIGFSVSDCLR